MSSSTAKIVDDPARLEKLLKSLARPLVFTNGCFDILHRGHVTYLEQAAQLGNSLVVGINDDASVRRQNKGGGRPINSLADRAAVLAALASVDLVVPFGEDTPLTLIMTIQPDHLVKGGDWPLNEIVGAKEVLERGGQVHAIPIRFHCSTTDVIRRIRRDA